MAVTAVAYPIRDINQTNRWVAGVASATRYPTNGFGGGDATNTNSSLSGADSVYIVGILMTTVGAGVAMSIVDHDGTDIPGFAFTLSAATPAGTFIPINSGYKATGTGASNIGLKLGAGIGATLFYR